MPLTPLVSLKKGRHLLFRQLKKGLHLLLGLLKKGRHLLLLAQN